MGKYVESTLMNGEQVIYEAKISLWRSWFIIFLGVIMIFSGTVQPNGTGGGTIVLGAILLVVVYLRYVTTELAVTNKRIIAKFGVISRRTIEMNLSKVESIRVGQSLFGRIFNYGSLAISGAGNPQVPVPGISKPMEFRKMAMETQDQAA